MGRVSASVCALGLAGCAQLFGIDDTSAPPDAALPPRGSLAIGRVSFGATTEVNPQSLAGLSAAYYIADDVETSGLRRITATAEGDVWTAELPDGVPAAVEFTLPMADTAHVRRLFALPNRDLHLQHGVYEHVGKQPAPMDALLTMQLTLPNGYASGQSFSLFAAGPWVTHSITSGLPVVDTGGTTIGPVDIAYSTPTFGSSVGENPLHQITSADRVVALRYVGSQLTAAGEIAPFTQTGADSISATLTEVTGVAPLDVSINAMTVASRLAMTTPLHNNAAALNWSVTAAPGYLYANGAGPQLNAGSLSPTAGTQVISASYANPFTELGWRTLFNFGSSRARTYVPPELNLPVTLYAGLNQHLEPAADVTADVPAGIPVLVLLNDTPLTTDGLTVTVDPNKAITLDLVADKPTSTYYQFAIYELVPGPGMPATALALQAVYLAVGVTSEITLPAGIFTTGKVYTIRAHCYQGGFPTISTGDFTNRDLPLSVGYLDSGVFTVAAP